MIAAPMSRVSVSAASAAATATAAILPGKMVRSISAEGRLSDWISRACSRPLAISRSTPTRRRAGRCLGSFRATQRQPSAQSSQTSPVLRIMSVLPRRAIISTSSLIPTTVAEMLCCIYLPSRPILSRSPLALLLLGPRCSHSVWSGGGQATRKRGLGLRR